MLCYHCRTPAGLLVASHDYEIRQASDGWKTDAALLLGGPFLLFSMHLVQASCCWTRKYMGRLHSLRQSVAMFLCPPAEMLWVWVCRFCGDEKLPCNCGAPACRGFVNAAKRSMEGDGMLVLRSRLKPYTGQKLVWDGE